MTRDSGLREQYVSQCSDASPQDTVIHVTYIWRYPSPSSDITVFSPPMQCY